jgi:hypothetical protein
MKPKNLYAFDGRIQDFEWTPLEPVPAKLAPVKPELHSSLPTPPSLPRMKISATPISAEELVKNLSDYYAQMERVPGWQELLAEENRKTKEAIRLAREARIVERRKAA